MGWNSLHIARAARHARSTQRALRENTRIAVTQLLHVLLVDAEPAGASMLEERLKRVGYRTTLARGLPQALERALETARRDRPDVIVLDAQAPQQTCRELKKQLPDLPIVVYSGEQRAANDCGADEFVARPADPALVMQKIVQLLARNKH